MPSRPGGHSLGNGYNVLRNRVPNFPMSLDLYVLLRDNSQLLLFLLLGIGYLLGNLRVAGFCLGPTSGVLVASLVVGHFQLELDPIIGTLGFLFFIYSVGLQAGPRFFSIVLEDGAKYISLAVVVVAISAALTWGLATIFDFGPGTAAGLMAGALTSASALAAAGDAVARGSIQMPPDLTAEQIANNLAAGYAITYLYGLIGLSVLVGLLPRWLRVDLNEEAVKISKQKNIPEEADETPLPIFSLRAYRIEDRAFAGGAPADLFAGVGLTNCTVRALKRNDKILEIDPETRLEPGDTIAVAAPVESLDRLASMGATLGLEVFDSDLLGQGVEFRSVMVTRSEAAGLSLGELGLDGRSGCYLTQLRRIGREMPLSEGLQLQKGDVLGLTGSKLQLDRLVARLGQAERATNETDLLTFALGIVIGCILGEVAVEVAGVSFGLGAAGGLLLSGIAFGFLRSIYPTFGRVPLAARWLMQELGILFFLAAVGVRAGRGILSALTSVGPALALCGVAVTTIPLLAGYFYGAKVLKLNPAILMGALTGAMTSTPALGVVTKEAKSSVPALGYAGTYAFANVFLTVAGGLIVRL